MSQAVQSVGAAANQRMIAFLGEQGAPLVSLTDSLTGPGAAGAPALFTVPVGGVTTIKVKATFVVTATSGPEVVGQAFVCDDIRFAWVNLNGTPSLMAADMLVPFYAGSSSLAGATSAITAGVSGTQAEVSYANPSGINSSTVCAITLNITTE